MTQIMGQWVIKGVKKGSEKQFLSLSTICITFLDSFPSTPDACWEIQRGSRPIHKTVTVLSPMLGSHESLMRGEPIYHTLSLVLQICILQHSCKHPITCQQQFRTETIPSSLLASFQFRIDSCMLQHVYMDIQKFKIIYSCNI